jgi:ABC-type nitrate/sulfonate/bicarbonate transport system substrate-binding protein
MNMKKAIIISTAVIFIAAVVGVLTHFFRSSTEHSAETPPPPMKVSLRLSGLIGPQHAGEIVAVKNGLFEHAGLHFELKPAAKGLDSIGSVAKGADTFGVASGIAFLEARGKGAPIVAFAAEYLDSPVVFYVLDKSGIHGPADFVHKRVLRRPGTNAAILYDALLESIGISRSNVREIDKNLGITALINHDVDVLPGTVGKEGYVLYEKGVQYDVIRPGDFGIHIPGTVFFTSEKVARDFPSLVQRFLDTVIAGWNQVNANEAKSVPLIVAAAGNSITPEQVLFELNAQRDYIRPLARRVAEFDDIQWKQLSNILINERLIPDSIDMSTAVNYSFLREAYRKSIYFGNKKPQ